MATLTTPGAGHAVAESPTAAIADISPAGIASLVAAGVAAIRVDSTAELLLGVTHDMRSPLSAMLILIERLRSGQAGPVTKAQEHQLGLLYGAALGLATMTNNAHELARGAEQRLQRAAAPFSISAVMRAVRDLVQPIAEERGLLLRFSGPAADRRFGNEAVVRRVLLNLTTNALKFTQRGSVSVSASAPTEHQLRFTVEDSGSGMPESALRPWGTVLDDAPTASGLGLRMCRQLLAELGGELTITPLLPTGTRVEFTLGLPPL